MNESCNRFIESLERLIEIVFEKYGINRDELGRFAPGGGSVQLAPDTGGGTGGGGTSSEREYKGIERGKHLYAQAGDDNKNVLEAVGDANAKFQGKLGSFLEKHPVAVEGVMYPSSGMRGANGCYEGNGRVRVLMQKKMSGKQMAVNEKHPEYAVHSEAAAKAGKKLYGNKKLNAQRAACQKATVCHELGHHVAMTLAKTDSGVNSLITSTFGKVRGKSTEYGSRHPQEFFAETFAAMSMGQKVVPEARNMVKSVMKKVK